MMTVTAIPDRAPVFVHWPTPAEKSEALAVGLSDYNLAQILVAPTDQATFHARYALRWGAKPEHVAAALAHVAARQ